VVNDAIALAIKQHLSENDIRHLVIRSGAKTLIDDGLSKLHETTLSEIMNAVPKETVDAFQCHRPGIRPAPKTDPPREKKEIYRTTLPAVGMQKADIRRLYHAYEAIAEKNGRSSRPSDPSAFETFIRAHHSALCRRYNCNRVAFSLERENGKPALQASPVFQ
jgi:hypothetical protein